MAPAPRQGRVGIAQEAGGRYQTDMTQRLLCSCQLRLIGHHRGDTPWSVSSDSFVVKVCCSRDELNMRNVELFQWGLFKLLTFLTPWVTVNHWPWPGGFGCPHGTVLFSYAGQREKRRQEGKGTGRGMRDSKCSQVHCVTAMAVSGLLPPQGRLTGLTHPSNCNERVGARGGWVSCWYLTEVTKIQQ